MNNPQTRFVIRAILAGLLAALVALQKTLPGISGDDLETALIGGAIVALIWGGVTYVTPIDKSVGVGKT